MNNTTLSPLSPLTVDVLVLGKGLAGLAAAAKLAREKFGTIAIAGLGHGGSPEIAALNAVMLPGPHPDSFEQHAADMMRAGYGLSDPDLLGPMCSVLPEGVHFLESLGIAFARENGDYKRRLPSGSTYPRALCDTGQLVGKQILPKLDAYLKDKTECINGQALRLLVKDGKVKGALVRTTKEELLTVYAPIVIAAWGGVGDLFPNSTYPADVDGSGLVAAYEAGLPLLDLEFIEFEPLVTIHPAGAAGEPCPTAMLGEGGHLLNSKGERFLLAWRPEGESGALKTLINKAMLKEIKAGNAGPHGGVFVDLRHIPLEVLKAYPWFYDKELKAGLDVKKELLEVGPSAHSLSGGVLVDKNTESPVRGLYAIGEACGGYHGACRMAGNAAAQTLATSMLCAKHILAKGRQAHVAANEAPETAPVPLDPSIRSGVRTRTKDILGKAMGLEREGKGLREALGLLASLEAAASADALAASRVTCAKLLCSAALAREESRGTHYRTDFPESVDEDRYSLRAVKKGGSTEFTRIPRSR